MEENQIVNQLSEEQIQNKLLDTVKYIDKFCFDNAIKYYMIGGTLLGSVRHGGFIPWDDDIDIAMTRNEYERFISLWKDEDHPNYIIQNYRVDKKCLHTITRILIKGTLLEHSGSYNVTKEHSELFVDIFPLDNVPNEKKLQEKQRKQLLKIKRLINYKFSTKASTKLKVFIKKVRKFLLTPISFNYLIKKHDRISQKYNCVETDNMCSMSSQYNYYKQVMKNDIYGEPKKMKFVDCEFLAPEQEVKYLSQLYGDYMKLPPIEKRVFSIKAYTVKENND